MRKVVLFMMVSMDGYFEGPNHDLSWHNVDKEFNAFAANNMVESGVLVFGRRTYELMANFWPKYKPQAGDSDNAVVTERMNNLPKIVFSKNLKAVSEGENWKNVTLKKGNIAEEIKKLKGQPGKAILVLGSSNLCVSLLEYGLLDELLIMVNPVVIGAGTPLFHGIKDKPRFKLLNTKTFKSGNILLHYQTTPKK
jgi:dihydrofolate reductase